MSACRLRKVECDRCGYVARVTRSWLEVGLPGCPCGGQLAPTDVADRAFIGLIGRDDMSGPDWTAVCKANGWDGAIQRKGAAQHAHVKRTGGSALYADTQHAEHCAFPGCGRWVKSGAETCSAGHPQSDVLISVDAIAPAEAAMPF